MNAPPPFDRSTAEVSSKAEGRKPLLSVVVPAHRAADVLERALLALCASDLPRDRWELLVVDDASDEATSRVAGRYADVVVRLPGPARGPAYARNRGFELASGENVAFVNADVAVRPGTLRGLVEHLQAEPTLGAVSATYDPTSPAPGIVSRYRNLLRHWEQRVTPADACELWAGCCAVRPAAFAAVGMFNEWHFARPSVEAAELSVRLRHFGAAMHVALDLPVTHLRDFTLGGMLKDDLHLRRFERARVLADCAVTRASRSTVSCVALVWVAMTCMAIAALGGDDRWATAAALMLAAAVVVEAPLYGFLARAAGAAFALAAVPVRLLSHAVQGAAHFAGTLLRHTVGEPRPDPTTEAWVEMGVETWPPAPAKRLPAAPGQPA